MLCDLYHGLFSLLLMVQGRHLKQQSGSSAPIQVPVRAPCHPGVSLASLRSHCSPLLAASPRAPAVPLSGQELSPLSPDERQVCWSTLPEVSRVVKKHAPRYLFASQASPALVAECLTTTLSFCSSGTPSSFDCCCYFSCFNIT